MTENSFGVTHFLPACPSGRFFGFVSTECCVSKDYGLENK